MSNTRILEGGREEQGALDTLREALLTANARVHQAWARLNERFPHLCKVCEGEGVRPDGEGGFEVCFSCVNKGLDPLDTRLELVCHIVMFTPQEAVEEGELDALTLRSTGAPLTDWEAHPHRHLDALQEELCEVEEALRQEELDAEDV